MTVPARDSRSSNLHRRLTVALAAAADRGHLADELTGALGGGATGATALRAADLLEAAGAFAAVRAKDRAELRARLESAAERASDARAAASSALDAVVARRAQLAEGATWARSLDPELARLGDAADAARRVLDAKAAELRAAQGALERVLEQRAAAASAVEDADRELGDMTSAGMDEPGLRRELEMAGRSVRDASVALRAATEARVALEHERAQVAAELSAAADLPGAVEPASPLGSEQIERVLDVYESFRGYVAGQTMRTARPGHAAAELIQAWQDLAADFAEARVGATPRPTDVQLRAAEAELHAATTVLERLERQRTERVLTPEQRAEIDAAHGAVLEAEERTGRRIRAGAANARLDAARAVEHALLERHGFSGYLEVILTGGRAGTQDPARREAETRYVAACNTLEALQRASTSPALDYLESERERLRDHTAELIGVDPGDVAVELLEQHPAVPQDVVTELREALADVGVRPVGVALGDAAEGWLTEQGMLAEQRMRIEESSQSEATRRAHLEARSHELEALIEAAERRVAEAEENLELAQRSVDALEAELTVRSGEDTKRLKRVAAAEQLRAQVDALESTLSRAEAAARSALDQAFADHRAAEVAFEQAAAELVGLSRRARALAAELPADRRPDGDPLETLDELADALDRLSDGVAPELSAAQQALAVATTSHDESIEALAVAASGSPDMGPDRDDLVDGLAQLLQSAENDRVLILDDPFAGVDADAREALLALVRAGSVDRQLVLLTEDPDVLGWAIELPADEGTALPAGALLARARRQPNDPIDDGTTNTVDAEPTTPSRRHAGRT